jgi:hypothetical protein
MNSPRFGGFFVKSIGMVGPVTSYLRKSADKGQPRPTLLKPGSATCWAPAAATQRVATENAEACRAALIIMSPTPFDRLSFRHGVRILI